MSSESNCSFDGTDERQPLVMQIITANMNKRKVPNSKKFVWFCVFSLSFFLLLCNLELQMLAAVAAYTDEDDDERSQLDDGEDAGGDADEDEQFLHGKFCAFLL